MSDGTVEIGQTNGESTALAILGQPTKTALILPAGLTFDEWEQNTTMLEQFHAKLDEKKESVQWWIGDCLVYGEQNYGEKYAQAIGDYKPDTIRGFQWAAEKIEPSRRVTGLSFSHHREVAALPPAEQDVWLGFARQDGWSIAEMKRRIKAGAAPKESAPEKSTECPFCQADLTKWLEER